MVSYPVVRIIGNIVSGSEDATQQIIQGNVLAKLVHVLDASQKKNVRKDSFWAVSNVMAGTEAQIQVRAAPPSLAPPLLAPS